MAPLLPDAVSARDTLQHGELFLTIKQFQQFLALRELQFNRRTVYRWLNLTKPYLPQSVQDLLKPAPMLWFIQIAPVSITGTRPTNIVIPLRYFNEELQAQATPLALHHIANQPQLTALATLKALNGQLLAFSQHVQQQIEELEHTHRSTYR
jgi:hypothetical protein